MIVETLAIVRDRHHPGLIEQPVHAKRARLVHRKRIVAPDLVDRQILAELCIAVRRRAQLTPRPQMAKGVKADEFQQAAHGRRLLRGLQNAFAEHFVRRVGKLVEHRRHDFDEHDFHVGGGPAAALREARDEFLEHELPQPVIIAGPPGKIIADQRQIARHDNAAIAAVAASGQRIEIEHKLRGVSHLPALLRDRRPARRTGRLFRACSG